MNSPLEEICAEIQNDPNLLDDFSEKIGDGEMPKSYTEHAVVHGAERIVVPVMHQLAY